MSDEHTDITESDMEDCSAQYRARKRRLVLLLLVFAGIDGVLFSFLPEETSSLLDFIVGLPILILALSWCIADSRERNHIIGRYMRLTIMLLFFVGFPLYLFQTRGIGGFKTMFKALLLAMAMLACMLVTGIATDFAGEAMGFWEVVE